MLFDMSRGKVGLILKFGTDIERVINKEHFYGKICRKCASKICTFLTQVNSQKQPMHARDYFVRKIF